MQHKDTANAVPWLEQIDAIHPGDARIASVLYKYYAGRGNTDKAEHYKQILIEYRKNRSQADEQQQPAGTNQPGF
jgi:hypothetical protein